jgi:hypothetical protein
MLGTKAEGSFRRAFEDLLSRRHVVKKSADSCAAKTRRNPPETATDLLDDRQFLDAGSIVFARFADQVCAKS